MQPQTHKVPKVIFRPFALALLALSIACSYQNTSIAATLPIPPATFDTSYSPPSGGTITVADGGDFQAALNSAQLGDTIILQAGATYRGPFTLPNKTSGTGWIYVRSSAYSNLPAPGTRVGTTDAANMPKIVSPANSNAMVTVANSHNYRFVGIEFTPVPGAFLYNLVTIGNQDATPATLPSDIVFDRCLVRADPAQSNIRGIAMDGVRVAVVDSHVSGFKAVGFDSQGLWAYNTTGPLKIVNNYIEAAGENIMFGGADSRASTLVPSDIEIRGNHFFKPLSWNTQSWVVKNLLEFKAARRAVVANNTFENSPKLGQSGHALLITPRNQDGNAPWTVVEDIAVVDNIFINVGGGLNILGTDDLQPTQMTARLLIRNNVLGVTGLNGALGRTFQILNSGTDITIDHNTVINTAPSGASMLLMLDSAGTKTDRLVITNNITTKTDYGVLGSGSGSGSGALNGHTTNWAFSKNALIGESANIYPTGNFFPVDVAAVQFASTATGDYRLAAGSPYNNAGTDNRDLGADLGSNTNLADLVAPAAPTNIVIL